MKIIIKYKQMSQNWEVEALGWKVSIEWTAQRIKHMHGRTMNMQFQNKKDKEKILKTLDTEVAGMRSRRTEAQVANDFSTATTEIRREYREQLWGKITLKLELYT